MFCAPELVFGCTDGVRSRFHVLRPRTRFQRNRGRRVQFSCFAVPNSFSAVPRVSGPVFIFCPSGLFFGDTEGVGARFSCFARPDSFSAVPRASGPIFMFCTSGLFFGVPRVSGPVFLFCVPVLIVDGTEGVGSHFHFFAAGHIFGGRRASDLVFMFCAPRLIFGGSEGIGSRFHPLRPRTHFRRYRGRRVPF
jgi:hypothetical protein